MAADIPRAVRALVLARDGEMCQRCGRPTRQIHHRTPRQAGGSADPAVHAPANLILLCGLGNASGCHGAVETRREQARAEGFLVPRGTDPATVPVLRFRRVRYLPGETWTPLEVACPEPDPWGPPTQP